MMRLPRTRLKFILICNALLLLSIFANAFELWRRAKSGEFGIEDSILIPIAGYSIGIFMLSIPLNVFFVWMTKHYPGPVAISNYSLKSFLPIRANLFALFWLILAVMTTLIAAITGSYEMTIVFLPWILLAFHARFILAARYSLINLKH